MRISIIIDLDPQAPSQVPQITSLVTGQVQPDPGLLTAQPTLNAIAAGAAPDMGSPHISAPVPSAASDTNGVSDAGAASGVAAAPDSTAPFQQTTLSIFSAGAARETTDSTRIGPIPQFPDDSTHIGMTSAGVAPAERSGTT